MFGLNTNLIGPEVKGSKVNDQIQPQVVLRGLKIGDYWINPMDFLRTEHSIRING